MNKFEEWDITSAQGYKIDGRTDFAEENTLNKCFVIVHGYCGTMNEHLHEEAARFFTSHGYDVVRFNLQSQEHKLRDHTLQTHAHYLLSVLEQRCKKYNKIYLSGHIVMAALQLWLLSPKILTPSVCGTHLLICLHYGIK